MIKKTGIGCLAIVGLFVVIGVIIAALGAGGSSSDPDTETTSATAHKKHGAKKESVAKKAAPKMTSGQENALGAAKDYLDFQAFSKKGLVKQLSSKYGDEYPKKDAVWAVNHLDVDWKEQAAKSGKEYLSQQHFSMAGLVKQLESPYGDQYTHEQAVYGAKKALQ